MATIQGTYKFSSGTHPLLKGTFNVNFTSNGKNFTYIKMESYAVYYNTTEVSSWGGADTFQLSSAYRTLKFGATPQTVSDDFYNWISQNATYTPPVSYGIHVYTQNVIAAADNPAEMLDEATLTFTAADGHELPDAVNVVGAKYVWDKATGTLSLSNPSSTVEIYIGYAESYEVASSDLIALARAIRAKAGVVEALTFDGMIAAVNGITTT